MHFFLGALRVNLSVMSGNFCNRQLQQTTFSDAFFLGALRVKFSGFGFDTKKNANNGSGVRWLSILMKA